jgi:hypothetical protein
MMFEISATVSGFGLDPNVFCCFDPTVVIARLRKAFPEVEVLPQDFAWRDFDAFRQHGVVGEAVRIAENDARRRGPLWVFRLPVPGKPAIRGAAERYCVRIFNEEPIPEPLRSRFLAFLEGLRFAPCVGVKSVRVEDNDELPA